MANAKQLTIPQLKSAINTYVANNKIAQEWNATYNIVGLLDTIGKIQTIDQVMSDKLAKFDGEYLSYGKTVEEWEIDLVLPLDPSTSEEIDVVKSAYPTYRPVSFSYDLGDRVFKATYKYNELNKGVHNEGQLGELIYGIQRTLTNSKTSWKYAVKREMFGKAATKAVNTMNSASATLWAAGTARTVGTIVKDASNATKIGIVVKDYPSAANLTFAAAVTAGYIVVLDLVKTIAKPVDSATGEAFLKAVKADVEIGTDISEGHSFNGNTLGATQGMTLLVKQGVMPSLEVDTQAGAFHLDKVSIPAEVIPVPDFGSADDSIYAILVDDRMARLFPTFEFAAQQENGEAAFMNYFEHYDCTAHISNNAFIKVYKNA